LAINQDGRSVFRHDEVSLVPVLFDEVVTDDALYLRKSSSTVAVIYESYGSQKLSFITRGLGIWVSSPDSLT
jgi:hypothetical protein